MTENQKLLIDYSDELSACKYGLRTFCVNNGLSNKSLKQSKAIAFYCEKKDYAIPSKSDELGFLLDIYFSNKCNYIKQGKIPRRKKIHLKIHQKKIRLTPEEFYNSKQWLSVRVKVFRTYGRVCMKCGTSNGEIHVDHIKPRSLFPKLELSFENLQVLCRDCNLEKSNFHNTDYRIKKP